MNNPKFAVAVLSGVLALAIQAQAQTMFQVNFKGTAETTNDSGAIVAQQVNNKTLVQDALTATGNTNSPNLTLVYVQNASTDPSNPGDFIEVVNTTNGTPYYTNLQFMYGGVFPPAITNSTGDQIVIGTQVIPQPLAIGDSLGGATINERITPKNTVIRATFNYTVLKTPSGSNTVPAVSGSLSSAKVFNPH